MQHNPVNIIETYVVLDDQSNACMGDTYLFDALKIQGPELEYELTTCSSQGENRRGRRGNHIIIEATDGKKKFTLPVVLENNSIPCDKNEIPTPEICRSFTHLRPIAAKIPEIQDDIGIHLLIGRNCPEPLQIRESRNGPVSAPWAQCTDLGWTVSGDLCFETVRGTVRASVRRTKISLNNHNPVGWTTIQNPLKCDNHIRISENIAPDTASGEDVFRETPDDEKKAHSIEDKRFLHIMQNGTHINRKGNLELPLPFRYNPRRLPNNYQTTMSRFKNLLKQLERKPEMMEQYLQFMEKVIERQHASPVPDSELASDNAWYLPHFGVYHPRKAQIRVVFDSSARCNGTSLNDALLQGPDQMNSLIGVLLRFRCHPIAVMGDIEQMFHSFHVNEEHRNYLRFFWFQENNPEKPVIQYRMNVHLFGNVSSPAIATYGLRMIAEENYTTYGEDVREFVFRLLCRRRTYLSARCRSSCQSHQENTRDVVY
ncbi:uncharacterized protein LOC102801454 [Saccoglossus kowalevskii]|uniref:Uncharacterized protein LOC102801454 n=1 Tax=Saccoglossus kowalevskii TaxID=10224 RepID=A0ABM0MQ05_SACKO|nr:PREDICTED: uncharacterized protein LOC102801454 [Saccoglossus kowalevskii]